MSSPSSLQSRYPWTRSPLISSAPMRLISGPKLACAVSSAQGLGFVGAGYEFDVLDAWLTESEDILKGLKVPSGNGGATPIGVGVILHAADLNRFLDVISKHPPLAAIWLFAPSDNAQLAKWTTALRQSEKLTEMHRTNTDIWIQVGCVKDAVAAARLEHEPDVIVVQGVADAGGHGLEKGAGLISLLPEVDMVLKSLLERREIKQKPHLVGAGGLATASSVAAAVCLGADGVSLGTLYLCTPESSVRDGYRRALVNASDGGQSTARTRVYDTLRGTNWPQGYGGRGVVNASLRDHENGMGVEENTRLYDEAMKKGDEGWGELEGRITTYGGTGVGLITDVRPAGQVTADLIEGCRSQLQSVARRL